MRSAANAKPCWEWIEVVRCQWESGAARAAPFIADHPLWSFTESLSTAWERGRLGGRGWCSLLPASRLHPARQRREPNWKSRPTSKMNARRCDVAPNWTERNCGHAFLPNRFPPTIDGNLREISLDAGELRGGQGGGRPMQTRHAREREQVDGALVNSRHVLHRRAV